MAIRPAVLSDRYKIYEIASSHPDIEDFGAPWYSHDNHFVDDSIWVFERGQDQIVAFMSMRFRKKDHGVSLYFLGVAENFRGKGYGSAMVDHLKRMVVASDRHSHIDLRVSSANLGAIKFWTRHGFEPFDEPPGGAPRRTHQLRWNKL